MEMNVFSLSLLSCALQALPWGLGSGLPMAVLCLGVAGPTQREEGGVPNLFSEMMMGATVQVQTSKEWRPPPVSLWSTKANVFLEQTWFIFFPKGNTISHRERIFLLAWLWPHSFQSNHLGITNGACDPVLWLMYWTCGMERVPRQEGKWDYRNNHSQCAPVFHRTPCSIL